MTEPAQFTDIEVEECWPEDLDRIVQQLGPASWNGKSCKVRCFANSVGFIKFAINRQGYGKVVE
jgi:hypothetical protein